MNLYEKEGEPLTIAEFELVSQQTWNDYLDEVRASGVINMFGAPALLQEKFGLPRAVAKAVFQEWTLTYRQCDEAENDTNAGYAS